MSLLGTPVFANPTTPLWLSNNGGVISGNLSIEGNLTTGTGIATIEGGGLGGLEILTSAGQQVTRIQHLPGVSPRTIIQSSDPIFFNQIGTAQGNTSLTVSAFGANADVLAVGGRVSATGLTLGNAGLAPTVGTGTLAAGSAIINTTASDVTSYILLTHTNLNASTAVGTLRVVNKLANSFTVNSVDATGAVEVNDLSDFDWVIINPA